MRQTEDKEKGIDLNLPIPIIMVNVCKLNSPIRRQKWSIWLRKKKKTILLTRKRPFQDKNMKNWGKTNHTKSY